MRPHISGRIALGSKVLSLDPRRPRAVRAGHVVDGHKEYRINEAEARVVRRLYTEYAAGRGLRALAQRLNAEHVPCPRPQANRGPAGWGFITIRDIIKMSGTPACSSADGRTRTFALCARSCASSTNKGTVCTNRMHLPITLADAAGLNYVEGVLLHPAVVEEAIRRVLAPDPTAEPVEQQRGRLQSDLEQVQEGT
jgi:hypothetical protein